MNKVYKNIDYSFKSKIIAKIKIKLYKNKTSFSIYKIQTKTFFKKSNQLLHNRSYMYELLGVEKDCTNEQIKEAFIRLARQYHPENNKDAGAIDMFRSLTNAYEALSNQKNRDLYNAYMDLDLYDPDWLIENQKEKFEKERDEYSKFYAEQREKANSNAYNSSNKNNDFSNDYENVFNSGYKETQKLKAEDIEVII
jgi:curved DNA-binding protein CbpA